MDSKPDYFLERLAGASILLSVAVVFVPLLFKEPDHAPDWPMPSFPDESVMTAGSETIDEGLDAVPAAETMTAEAGISAEAAHSDATASVGEPEPVPGDHDAVSVVDDEEKQAPAVAPNVDAWIVQIGGFGQQANADLQQTALREDGYKAFVNKSVIDGREIFLVQVGPVLSLPEAEALHERLYSERRVKGIIKKYP